MSAQPRRSEVVLVLDADTERGHTTAHQLLQAGCRVAVSARHAAPLARIVHGYNVFQAIAIVADSSDPAQLDQLVSRVERRFGHAVDRIVRTGDERRLAWRPDPDTRRACRPTPRAPLSRSASSRRPLQKTQA
jgi:hypothetical protein